MTSEEEERSAAEAQLRQVQQDHRDEAWKGRDAGQLAELLYEMT